MPAPGRLEQTIQLHGSPVLIGAHGRVVDFAQEAFVHLHVRPRIEEHAVALEPVTSGAPHFLIPRLHVLRHVPVDDEAHVRLVDPHAERHGRDHDVRAVGSERLLVADPLIVRQPGMIGERVDAVGLEKRGRLIHRLPAQAVHDATLPFPSADEGEDLALRVAPPLLPASDQEIRAEERALVTGGLAHAELLQDVAGYRAGRRGGERQHRHVEAVLQAAQPPVRRPKVVSPL